MPFIDWLIGKPLATKEAEANRATVWTGIPMLGLDALSSAAYGPEAALVILLPLGAVGLEHIGPIVTVIVALLLILYFSYRQTIHAYPQGGGSYTVARENLGTTASLFAAAALLIDYILTVSVGVSAGVGALISAVPELHKLVVPLCVGILALITLVNLRGVRESGVAFFIPTYVFILALLGILALGIYKSLTTGGHPLPVLAPPPLHAVAAVAAPWVLMRSFASGCTAMTGVEAVSNGIQAFKEPRVNRAQATLTSIVVILAILLLGIGYLCRTYQIGAMNPEANNYQSVISQLVFAIVGRGPLYYITLFSVIAVLCLSANTGFADFPRLTYMIAEDEFLPHFFATRGRRLVYSVGIIILAFFCAALLIGFKGITDRLIPLYAIGAFLAFTLSQAGMVAHWLHNKGKNWKLSLAVNGLGAVCTGFALAIILAAKFMEGAWIVVLLIPFFVFTFASIHRHYAWVEKKIERLKPLDKLRPKPPVVLLPVKDWNIISESAVVFALSISSDILAVHVTDDENAGEEMKRVWKERVEDPLEKEGSAKVPLDVVLSPYRRMTKPILDEAEKLKRKYPGRTIAVIVPELVESKWFQYPLHNQHANLLKAVLLFSGGKDVVVINVPWYLKHCDD